MIRRACAASCIEHFLASLSLARSLLHYIESSGERLVSCTHRHDKSHMRATNVYDDSTATAAGDDDNNNSTVVVVHDEDGTRD